MQEFQVHDGASLLGLLSAQFVQISALEQKIAPLEDRFERLQEHVYNNEKLWKRLLHRLEVEVNTLDGKVLAALNSFPGSHEEMTPPTADLEPIVRGVSNSRFPEDPPGNAGRAESNPTNGRNRGVPDIRPMNSVEQGGVSHRRIPEDNPGDAEQTRLSPTSVRVLEGQQSNSVEQGSVSHRRIPEDNPGDAEQKELGSQSLPNRKLPLSRVNAAEPVNDGGPPVSGSLPRRAQSQSVTFAQEHPLPPPGSIQEDPARNARQKDSSLQHLPHAEVPISQVNTVQPKRGPVGGGGPPPAASPVVKLPSQGVPIDQELVLSSPGIIQEDPFIGGLITKLQNENALVIPRCSSTLGRDGTKGPRNLLDGNLSAGFQSDREKGEPWFAIQFTTGKVQVTDYALRGWGVSSPQSWVLEGADAVDSDEWEQIDQQNECPLLKQDGSKKNPAAKFHISQPGNYFQVIRLRQTGPNHARTNYLAVLQFEVFGQMISP
jgi:hypothetical protein